LILGLFNDAFVT